MSTKTQGPPLYPPPPPPDLEQHGRAAFELYSRVRQGAAVDGSRIPAWPDLNQEIRDAWCWAAAAVLNQAATLDGRVPPYPPPPPPDLEQDR
jgi:hypothetical protein